MTPKLLVMSWKAWYSNVCCIYCVGLQNILCVTAWATYWYNIRDDVFFLLKIKVFLTQMINATISIAVFNFQLFYPVSSWELKSNIAVNTSWIMNQWPPTLILTPKRTKGMLCVTRFSTPVILYVTKFAANLAKQS